MITWPAPFTHTARHVFRGRYDRDTAQVVFEALPSGAAGTASIVPVPGVNLTFDRSASHLTQITVDLARPGGDAPEFVAGTIGGPAASAIRQVVSRDSARFTLQPDHPPLAPLARLAGLRAAQATSPVTASGWWAVETAVLARLGGLARTARTAGASRVSRVPWAHEGQEAGPADGQERWAVPGEAAGAAAAWVQSWLDPALVDAGTFQHDLWPDSELHLTVSGPARCVLVAEADLATGSDPELLMLCRARLVDAASRQVLAVSPLRTAGRRARAEFRCPAPPGQDGDLWLEFVADVDRPVQSSRLRRMRRALRWADAALRAGSQPAGLPPARTEGEWSALAAAAWERCRQDWASAGDADRACLAGAQRAALSGSQPPGAPSWWSAILAAAPAARRAAFLAEDGGCPAAASDLTRAVCQGIQLGRPADQCPRCQAVVAAGCSITTTSRRNATTGQARAK